MRYTRQKLAEPENKGETIRDATMKQDTTTLRAATLLLLALSAGLQPPASAWDATGHQIVARIAWENMTPQARQRAVSLLHFAPVDSSLPSLFPRDPTGARSLLELQREFFVRASTWPDLVRSSSRDFPDRMKYHQRDWHFFDFHWDQNGPGGTPRNRPDLDSHNAQENIIERLETLSGTVTDRRVREDVRAMHLAWILHLVGDIHQPLHCSARATPEEPTGDGGGNGFKLERLAPGSRRRPLSLHSYWDNIFDRALPRQRGEPEEVYIARLAGGVAARFPRASLRSRLRPDRYRAWAQEGFATSKARLYPPSLVRFQMPDDSYLSMATATSMPAIALGGYRLADTLNRLFPAPS